MLAATTFLEIPQPLQVGGNVAAPSSESFFGPFSRHHSVTSGLGLRDRGAPHAHAGGSHAAAAPPESLSPSTNYVLSRNTVQTQTLHLQSKAAALDGSPVGPAGARSKHTRPALTRSVNGCRTALTSSVPHRIAAHVLRNLQGPCSFRSLPAIHCCRSPPCRDILHVQLNSR